MWKMLGVAVISTASSSADLGFNLRPWISYDTNAEFPLWIQEILGSCLDTDNFWSLIHCVIC